MKHSLVILSCLMIWGLRGIQADEAQPELLTRITRQTNACTFTIENERNVCRCNDATLDDVSSTSLGESAASVQILILATSSIPVLPQGSLQHLEALTDMTIAESALNVIENGAFDGIEKLIRLSLASNEIDSLPASQFQQLSELKKLNLSSNKIQNIDYDSLKGLSNLQVLDLSKNQLETLPQSLFKNTPMLALLDLSGNRINKLPGRLFFKLQYLSALDLGRNKLANLPQKLFDLVPNLSRVVFSHNNIRFLSSEIFAQPLLRMTLLRMDNNELVWANATALYSRLPVLEKASWVPNPWSCPCLANLMEWARFSNISVVLTDYLDGKRPACVINKRNQNAKTGELAMISEVCEKPTDQDALSMKTTYQTAIAGYEKTVKK